MSLESDQVTHELSVNVKRIRKVEFAELVELVAIAEQRNGCRDRPAGCLRLAIAPAARGAGPGPPCGVLSRHQDRILADDGSVDIASGHFDAAFSWAGSS